MFETWVVWWLLPDRHCFAVVAMSAVMLASALRWMVALAGTFGLVLVVASSMGCVCWCYYVGRSAIYVVDVFAEASRDFVVGMAGVFTFCVQICGRDEASRVSGEC